ncbi:hypothetical protein BDR26DRAFT_412941 [Obelidium mucronatum]|nr:hypothetical protein BDR26DRAFT_412941 [Obelidium mucronatum]
MDSYSKKLYNQVKDSIYRGAANTISKYEHEPYFLVSTFKGLQKLDTPYLRQKFLLLLDSVLEERDQIQNEEPDPELAGETGDADSFDEDNEYLENKLADDSMEPLGNSVSQWEASSPARISGRNQRAYFHDVESDENVGYGVR